MAEIVELFEVKIDIAQATKDLANSQRSVQALKDEIKQLSAAEGDNSEKLAALTVNLKVQQGELRTNTNLATNAIKATNAQKGSIEQMRAQLSVTSIEWAKLSKEGLINTERGKALVKQKTELAEALKKEEMATGDARRNVGNYADGMKQALGNMEQLRAQLSSVSVQWDKLSKEKRKNSDEGKALAKQKLELNNALKDEGKALAKQKLELTNALKREEEATGDASRNVGNYSDGIKQALGVTTQFIPGASAASGAVKQLGFAFSLSMAPILLIVGAIALVVAAFKAFFLKFRRRSKSTC